MCVHRFRSFAYYVLPLSILTFSVGACSSAVEREDLATTSEAEGELVAGRRWSEAEMADLIRYVGFEESVVGTMLCIVRRESSFYEGAENHNRNGSIDRGLFQINSIHIGETRGCPSYGEHLFDAETNARCAYGVYRAQGLRAWATYSPQFDCMGPQPPPPPPGSGVNPSGLNYGASDGSCFSPTLGESVTEGVCVQSRSNRIFYICEQRDWLRISEATLESGACLDVYPL